MPQNYTLAPLRVFEMTHCAFLVWFFVVFPLEIYSFFFAFLIHSLQGNVLLVSAIIAVICKIVWNIRNALEFSMIDSFCVAFPSIQSTHCSAASHYQQSKKLIKNFLLNMGLLITLNILFFLLIILIIVVEFAYFFFKEIQRTRTHVYTHTHTMTTIT